MNEQSPDHEISILTVLNASITFQWFQPSPQIERSTYVRGIFAIVGPGTSEQGP